MELGTYEIMANPLCSADCEEHAGIVWQRRLRYYKADNDCRLLGKFPRQEMVELMNALKEHFDSFSLGV